MKNEPRSPQLKHVKTTQKEERKQEETGRETRKNTT